MSLVSLLHVCSGVCLCHMNMISSNTGYVYEFFLRAYKRECNENFMSAMMPVESLGLK